MNDWIEEEFGDVSLGDQRLNQRVRLLLARKWEKPGASFSAACQGHKEVVAASRFFNNEKPTQEKILGPHRTALLDRIRAGQHPQVLLVQDTSECDYSSHKKLQGTGPLSSQDRRGFFAHNHLVVTPERLPLGLWDTAIDARDDAEHGKAAARKQRPIEQKESFRWLEGYRHACALAAEVPGCQVVSMGDRESDIYEVFVESWQRRAQGLPTAELLIRSKEDRCLEPFEEKAATGTVPVAAAGQPSAPNKIRSRLAASPVLGTVKFRVPAATRDQKVKGNTRRVTRSGRDVAQEVRAVRVRLQPPYRSAAAGGPLPAGELTLVEAREINPPAGEEALVWILLTTLPVDSFEQASAVLRLYLCRWEIELFHRILKSGCHLEQIQQRHDFSLKLAILLYMIIAWRLLYVMRLGRTCPELPCDLVFDESEWKSVVVALKGRAALQHKPSVGEMVRMIAQLGGHLGRKNDSPPGMKSMWIGMTRLADFAFCWERFGANGADPG